MEADGLSVPRTARLFELFKRVSDTVLAGSLLLGLAPFVLLLSRPGRGTWIDRHDRVGRFRSRFQLRVFGPAGPHIALLSLYPALWNIIRGDMSFIGPRPSPPEPSDEARAYGGSLDVRPGLFCLGWLRQRGNIAWDGEFAADAEYLRARGFSCELGMWLRLFPALVRRGSVKPPPRFDLLGFTVDNLTMDQAVRAIVTPLQGGGPRHVAFLNAHYANVAAGNAEYRSALRCADLLLPDGSGLRMAGRMRGTPVLENVNGTDLFPRLCSTLEQEKRSLYLIGGRPGRAAAVGRWVGERYPTLKVSGSSSGYMSEQEWDDTVRLLRAVRPDVVLVGLGAPNQDIRIRQTLMTAGAGTVVSVGGLFDFYSGEIPRAPVWMRELGVEWIYRLAQEPHRMWRRYLLGNARFLYSVWRDSRNMPAKRARLTEGEECAR